MNKLNLGVLSIAMSLFILVMVIAWLIDVAVRLHYAPSISTMSLPCLFLLLGCMGVASGIRDVVRELLDKKFPLKETSKETPEEG